MERKGFLNVGEIAAKMGVSEATVWGLIKRREVDRYKFPGDRRTFVSEDQLSVLMEPEKIGGPGRPRGTGEASKRAA